MAQISSATARIDRIDHDNPQTGVVTLKLADTTRPTFVKGPAPALQPGMSVDILGARRESESTIACTLIRPAWPGDVGETARALNNGWLGRLNAGAAWQLAQRMGRLSLDILAVADPDRFRARYGIRDPHLARTCRIARSVANARKALDLALKQNQTPRDAVLLIRREGAERALGILNGTAGPKTGSTTAKAPGTARGIDLQAGRAELGRRLNRAERAGHCALVAQDVTRKNRAAGHALDSMIESGELASFDGLVQTAATADLEAKLAAGLVALKDRGAPVDEAERASAAAAGQRAAGVHLSPDQAQALTTLLGAPIGVLTGGPGTGKSALTRAVVGALAHARLSIQLAAPTGKAARRLAEATGKTAETLHRTLGIKPGDPRRKKVTADILIVDESSMIDLELAVEMLAALGPKTRLILVGDADQLPSVGPGQVLCDIIDSGVIPVARLTQVHRQDPDSGIVGAARAVNAGRLPDLTPRRDGEVFFLPTDGADRTAALTVDLAARRLPSAYNLEPLDDVQTLAAMRQRDACGTRNLNAALQSRLVAASETGLEVVDGTLRPGDRAIQTVNDPQIGLINGDTGRVVSADTYNGLTLEMADERRIDLSVNQARRLAPAHALTVHKSQGSEYHTVVMPITQGQEALLTRRMIYTALTRAKGIAVLLGCRKTLSRAIARDGDVRTTGLAARLRAEGRKHHAPQRETDREVPA